jgi:hypothetical protein
VRKTDFPRGGKKRTNKLTFPPESAKLCRRTEADVLSDLLEQIGLRAGLPDGLFSNQKSHFLGFRLEIFINFMAIWNISWIFGIFYDHSVHFVFIWYIFFSFGIMHQEKSGNPD